MKKELLDLSHKELLNAYICKKKSFFSEYNFANLYLFRNIHQYEVVFYEESLFLRGVSRSEKSFSIPFCSLTPQNIEKELKEAGSFYALSEEEASFFSEEEYKKYFLESESDYIYFKESFLDYNSLKKKEKKITKLKEQHHLKIEKIGDANEKHARVILEEWQRAYKEESDFSSCLEALEKRALLELEGDIVYIEEKPAAFFLGEKYHPEAYLLHFAKASLNFDGLYPLLYQHAALRAENRTYINLEQDMGDPFLKKSKTSYHPEKMARKFHIEKR